MFLKHKNFFKITKKILNRKPTQNVERINLHENTSDKDQLMIIWQKKNYCHRPKKFLDSHKVFFCLKGKLKIFVLSNSGKIISSFILDDKNLLSSNNLISDLLIGIVIKSELFLIAKS